MQWLAVAGSGWEIMLCYFLPPYCFFSKIFLKKIKLSIKIALSLLKGGRIVGLPPTPAPTSGLLGDENSDKSVDILDALMMAQYYVGLNPPDFNPDAADVNCDGIIDIIDALVIAKYYVGLISEFCI